ncbi:PRAME family member 12-like [Acomys russatus]|uniref:PRAME family member 12-like n=1 Tax=Acomys russatus TaxID=60746 RepID=UPI0021E1EF95|nr:PRAME family member 12-like [Acomys russatus]
MSVDTPATLLKLARQALLRDEALAIWGLEQLPRELLPALFKEAFTGRHTLLVKATVASWPFPCLPVGALMKTPDLETFQAVLAGVDMRLKKKPQPRTGKLQVVDLSNEQHPFWSLWAGAEHGGCSAEGLDEMRAEKVLPRYALRQRLKVVVELCLRPRPNPQQACFLQWAQQRQGSLHLCCRKMQIWAQPLHGVRQILTVFPPEHLEELELNTEWNVSTLAQFAPCLGQMRNLRKLSLAPISKNVFRLGPRTRDGEEKCVRKFLSQFSRFNCLRHLSLRRVDFLRDHMRQALGCLVTPLETLSITYHLVSQADLKYLSVCPNLFQLKHLDMRGMVLTSLDVTPLRVLLNQVAETLHSLDLRGCKMRDSHLTVLTPALGKCSQLTKVHFVDNEFSMPILKELWQHTDNWSKMEVEQYPAPLECYGASGYVSVRRFAQLCPELLATLRAFRQPKSIVFATAICPQCGVRSFYDLAPRLCYCRR